MSRMMIEVTLNEGIIDGGSRDSLAGPHYVACIIQITKLTWKEVPNKNKINLRLEFKSQT